MTPLGAEWAAVTAHDDVSGSIEDLRHLVGKYLAEADAWTRSTLMHSALVDTARRLSAIADDALPATLTNPDHADVVAAFAFAARMQLEHVQSTRRFAWGEAPHIIPRRVGGDRVKRP